jgi:hypothetical protein
MLVGALMSLGKEGKISRIGAKSIGKILRRKDIPPSENRENLVN